MHTETYYQTLLFNTLKLIQSLSIKPEDLATHPEIHTQLSNEDPEVQRITRCAIAASLFGEDLVARNNLLDYVLLEEEGELDLGLQPIKARDATIFTALAALKDFKIITLKLFSCELEELEITRVTQLADALMQSAVTNLETGFNKLNNWNLDCFTTFFAAVARSNITSLSLFDVKLGEWDLPRMNAFACALSASKIIALELHDNDIGKLAPEIRQVLLLAIKNSPVKELNLRKNNLGKLKVECINLFSSKLTNLNISRNNLDSWHIEEVTAFANWLKSSKVFELEMEDNQLYLWSLIRVDTFAAALEKSEVEVLNLDTNNLGNFPLEYMTPLFNAISNSKVSLLYLGENNLFSWDAACMRVFCNSIKDSNIKTLSLQTNALRLEQQIIQAFAEAIAQKIQCINLINFCMAAWDESLITKFAGGLHAAPMKTLLMGGRTNLYSWPADRINAFGSFISVSNLIKLDLSESPLGHWNLQDVIALRNALSPSKIKILNMKNCELNKWDEQRIYIFANGLRNKLDYFDVSENKLGSWNHLCLGSFAPILLSLHTLNLSNNELNLWQTAQLKVFSVALQNASKLNVLDLQGNDLEAWTLPSVKEFADTLISSNIRRLNLSGCRISDWDLVRVKEFARVLAGAKIKWLDLSVNWHKSDNRWDVLMDALRDNSSIQGINGCIPLIHRVYLSRNQDLQFLQDNLLTLQRLENETNDEYGARCEEVMVPAYNLLVDLSADAMHLKWTRRLEALIVTVLTQLLSKDEFRFDEIVLGLSALNAKVRDIYFEYLQHSYLRVEANLNEPRKRFMAAIVFLMDVNKLPIRFTKAQQQWLDTLLLAACGMVVNMGEYQQTLNAASRLTLLRYLHFQALLDVLLTSSNTMNSIEMNIILGVRQEISELIGKSPIQVAMHEQHQAYKDCLDKINQKLERSNLNILHQAPMLQLTTVMTHLEDIEKKTAEFAQWFESSRLQTTTIEAFIKHSHLCIDQYDRLIQQPEAHLQKLDSVLAQLNRQADAARLTQLQLLVCNYFNPSFQSSSSNSTFFQQQELKAVNEIEKTFMQNTKNIGKLPEPLQRLIKVIQSEMDWAVFEDKVAAPQTGVC